MNNTTAPSGEVDDADRAWAKATIETLFGPDGDGDPEDPWAVAARAIARAEAAEAQVEGLKAALEPFARIGELIEHLGPKANGAAFNLTEYGRHCRAARAALPPKGDA